jgi:hypothetical protein
VTGIQAGKQGIKIYFFQWQKKFLFFKFAHGNRSPQRLLSDKTADKEAGV